MRMVLTLCLAVTTSLMCAQDLTGTWINELGSQLVIDSVDTNGFLFGEYRSSSGVDGKVFPMQGWTNRKPNSPSIAVAFNVHWGEYGSITSWSGYLDQDVQGLFLKTLWHLVRPTEKQPWERIISNSSTYRKEWVCLGLHLQSMKWGSGADSSLFRSFTIDVLFLLVEPLNFKIVY